MDLSPTDLARARHALSAALDGSGPPVEFTADGQVLPRPEATDPARGGCADVVAVVRTSGSTGTPKQTLLTRDALAASAAATAARIGGEGQWLLAVGLQFVAGLAVLSRSLQAGTVPALMPAGPFTPGAFADAVRSMPATGQAAGFRAVSLVPTQLARLLGAGPHHDAGPDPLALEALRTFDAVLVGGARVTDAVRAAAEDARINLYLTYGMSETCGGCVYDGVPLDGVTAETVTDPVLGPGPSQGGSQVPRLRLSGPMVAAGYLDDPVRTAAHFGTAPGAGPTGRWYLTEDTGTVEGQPGHQRLTVTGRVDDVINTGGVKVSSAGVQAVLESLPGVRAAFAGGIPDDEWGQRVCAAVALRPGADGSTVVGTGDPPFEAAARDAVRAALGPAAVPKQWLILHALPLLPNGKTDRQDLLRRFASSPPPPSLCGQFELVRTARKAKRCNS